MAIGSSTVQPNGHHSSRWFSWNRQEPNLIPNRVRWIVVGSKQFIEPFMENHSIENHKKPLIVLTCCQQSCFYCISQYKPNKRRRLWIIPNLSHRSEMVNTLGNPRPKLCLSNPQIFLYASTFVNSVVPLLPRQNWRITAICSYKTSPVYFIMNEPQSAFTFINENSTCFDKSFRELNDLKMQFKLFLIQRHKDLLLWRFTVLHFIFIENSIPISYTEAEYFFFITL